jgi:hypothetical protein
MAANVDKDGKKPANLGVGGASYQLRKLVTTVFEIRIYPHLADGKCLPIDSFSFFCTHVGLNLM